MEQRKWDEEKWPGRKESVYAELFGRKEERDITSIITDEDIERMREGIGVRRGGGGPGRAFNLECNRDNLRHLAQGNGDLNPLYWNEEYAKNTRWGGLIAPPNFLHCTGTSAPQEFPLRETKRSRGGGDTGLRGIQTLYSGEDCYFYRPIRPGDFVWTGAGYLYDVQAKKSEFSGIAVHSWNLGAMANQKGELLCVRKTLFIATGRQTKVDKDGYGERKKYANLKKQYYTPEDIKRIDADMDREEIRGAKPRYWEDVNEGDELTPVVKGPLNVNDMAAFDIGHGITMYDGAHHIAYNYRKRHPAAWPLNAYGIPDSVESVHWMDKLGRQVTNVGAYNYGEQTYAWLCHVVTNWMGDDAWLYYVSGRWRRFIYNGDTTWVRGKVTRKYRDDAGQYKVDLEIYCQDQRGAITAPGNATVILPSKVGGLPQVPPLDTPAPFKPEEVEFPIGKEPVWRKQLTF